MCVCVCISKMYMHNFKIYHVYIVIHKQIVSLYHNTSVWLDT